MHTISFKQVIDEQKKGQDMVHQGLFTKLKQNIMKQSPTNQFKSLKPIYTKSANSLLKEYELQFEILKLQKANYVVQMHLKTGAPIKAVVQQIMIDLEEQIQTILYQKQKNLVETKANSHLQQTFGEYDEPVSLNLKTEEGSNKAYNMKNIEFTLGNREISSEKSNSNKTQGEQVSQFSVNNKILLGSKGIRQKVMGRKQK